jgi:hypothetical protein
MTFVKRILWNKAMEKTEIFNVSSPEGDPDAQSLLSKILPLLEKEA